MGIAIMLKMVGFIDNMNGIGYILTEFVIIFISMLSNRSVFRTKMGLVGIILNISIMKMHEFCNFLYNLLETLKRNERQSNRKRIQTKWLFQVLYS